MKTFWSNDAFGPNYRYLLKAVSAATLNTITHSHSDSFIRFTDNKH